MPRIPGTEVQPGYFLPLITIKVRIGSAEQDVLALVDSGADVSIVNAEIVEALGVQFSSLPMAAVQGQGTMDDGDRDAGKGVDDMSLRDPADIVHIQRLEDRVAELERESERLLNELGRMSSIAHDFGDALERIAELQWNPAIGHSAEQMREIARRALEVHAE